MPKGIILIGWTNKEGFFLIHKHPADVALTDEEVMRIGSTHRMRNLDANVISLRLKNLNVVSFFSGLITSKYHIAPNFVISLLLDHSENPRDYIKILPMGTEIVLSEFPIERFDARTTSFRDVLSKIGKSYNQTLPKLYKALINREIEEKADMDEFFDKLAHDLETPSEIEIISESDVMVLRKKIKDQEGIIKMFQNILEGKDFSNSAIEYIVKIENLESQISNLERIIKEKDSQISELEIQLARIDILGTQIQTLQSDIVGRDAEIADLRTRLKVSSGHPAGISESNITGASSEQIEIWKNKIFELQNELLERNSLINKLKNQLINNFDEKEARAILAELSQKLTTQSSFNDDLEDEMKSKYITL